MSTKKTLHRGLNQLRDYQQHAVDMTLDLWGQGLRSVLFVCPTGGGKTFVFAELARLNKGRTLILADRKRLVDQAAQRVQEAGLTVGFEQGERRTGKKLPDVVCATIQSMNRERKRLRQFKPDAFSLIVVDEADLGIAPTYRTVLDYFKGALVFGCTATPDRADGHSLGSVFDEIAATVEMEPLIERRLLSDLRGHRVVIESVSLENASTKKGDFIDRAMERILSEERALHEVVKPSMELAGDRPSLVFAATVAHAENLAAMFNRYRPGCARVIHGKTEDQEREKILDAFQRREFQFLCNCSLMLRGVDLPLISCVVMARPTLSRALYAQSIGRGTRVDDGKENLLVVDFTDNSDRHDLMSVVDVLLPQPPPEARPKSGGGGGPGPREPTLEDVVRERAKEIIEDDPGCDPLEAIRRARREVAADAVLRERVRARVEYKLRGAPSGWRYDYVDWESQPLGKVSDMALAKRLEVGVGAVAVARKKRGIPPAPHPNKKGIDWNVQPLGELSDEEIGKRLGVSPSQALYQRKKRGIPALPHPRYRYIDWDRQPLGQMTDEELGKRLNISRGCVGRARQQRGIPRYVFRRDGTENIDWDTQPLGKIPDEELATRLGISRSAVCQTRRRRGIPPHGQIDWNAQPLGQISDAELGRQLGLTGEGVAYQRVKRNIPPYRPAPEGTDRAGRTDG